MDLFSNQEHCWVGSKPPDISCNVTDYFVLFNILFDSLCLSGERAQRPFPNRAIRLAFLAVRIVQRVSSRTAISLQTLTFDALDFILYFLSVDGVYNIRHDSCLTQSSPESITPIPILFKLPVYFCSVQLFFVHFNLRPADLHHRKFNRLSAEWMPQST